MKKCPTCNTEKELIEFSKCNTKNNDGFQRECKTCKKEYQLNYTRTIKGLITQIYHSQVSSSKRRKIMSPNYCKADLYNWCVNNSKFISLYDNWVKSEYNSNLKPSLDRVKSNLGYKLLNLQVITWEEHRNKSYLEITSLENTKGLKAVYQICKDTKEILNIFKSIKSASDFTGVLARSICSVCKGKRKSAGGYIWEYKNK